ncbi:MAG: hypothetical protein ABJH45_03895, partial [Paracoccaceae bacterium]
MKAAVFKCGTWGGFVRSAAFGIDLDFGPVCVKDAQRPNMRRTGNRLGRHECTVRRIDLHGTSGPFRPPRLTSPY